MALDIITSISIIIGIAALLTILARAIKQPPIIAYLVAGVIVGPIALGLVGQGSQTSEFLQIFARIGVALLLFIVGLSLDFRVLKEFGKVAALVGIGEIIVTSSIGFLISLALGFSFTPALYLAAALAFSSTVVIVKILSDKKEIDTLHGRIALGILIVEDFVAAIVLMLIPALQSGYPQTIFLEIGKIAGLIVAIFLVSIFIVNKLIHHLAKHQETLFLFGIAWALVLAGTFNYFGLSMEIGALIAGMSLASSKYTLELGGKIKPLRDFFVVLLFVFFGSRLVGPLDWTIIKEALILSAFIFIGKPIIVMTFVRFFGFKKRTTFLTGSSLAQISEFSLILILIGFNLGQLDQSFMNLAILVSLITIGISSYSIHYSHRLFNKFSNFLDILENGNVMKEKKREEKIFDIVLFGYHRIGYKILQTLKKQNANFVVVDYNPKVILSLEKIGVNCMYGDAADSDFLSEMHLNKSKIIISTIPQEEANSTIREHLKKVNSKATFIATAEQPRAALDLYEQGVDYVIVPHHLGGSFVSTIVQAFGTDKEKYKKAGKDHYKELKSAKDSSTFN